MNFNISSKPEDTRSFSDAVKRSRIAEEKKLYSLDNLTLKSHNKEAFITYLKENDNFKDLYLYDFSKNTNAIFEMYECDIITIEIYGNSNNLTINVFAKTQNNLHDVWESFQKATQKDKKQIDLLFNTFTLKFGNLYEAQTLMLEEDIDYINKSYYPYIDTDTMFDQFFTGDENILILAGEPGLGKSKLSTLALKYALNNPDKIPYDKIVEDDADEQYINAASCKCVEILTNDSFWRSIEISKPDFVILDDLDNMLTSRNMEAVTQTDANKNLFLNQFLSFTDGITKSKTKFIITTNQSYESIDSALLRKGRLFDIIELRKLTKSEALDIWLENNIDPVYFEESFGDREFVLSSDIGSAISKFQNERISNSRAKYILEPGISKIMEAQKVKAISL